MGDHVDTLEGLGENCARQTCLGKGSLLLTAKSLSASTV
jgi:hypothetical protein